MHDIDRVQLEQPEVAHEDEDEQFLFEDEADEQEDEQFFEHEQEDEVHEHEHGLSETQEIELANQVLEIGSEQELEQFLGDFLRTAADKAGRFARSKTGRQLGGILKNAAIQALPVVGRALGGPSGARAGRNLGDAARCFGLQQEALSGDDAEFELARHYLNFADCATRRALRRFNSAPPQQVARQAATMAARRHAPGLPLPRVLAAPPLRRIALASAGASSPSRRPGPPRNGQARRVPESGAASTRPAPQCSSCGSPLTGTSGRWVLRGNGVVLLRD